MLLRAGDMVVFDTKVFHHGTENVSATRRMLLCFSILASSSDMQNVLGYFNFFGTPDVRAGQFLIGDMATTAKQP